MITPHQVPKHELVSLNEFIENLSNSRLYSSKHIYIGFPDSSHSIPVLAQILDIHLSPIVKRNVNDTSSFNGKYWKFNYSSFIVPDEKLKTFIEAAVKIKSYIYVRKSLINNDDNPGNNDSDFYSLADFYSPPVDIQKIIL